VCVVSAVANENCLHSDLAWLLVVASLKWWQTGTRRVDFVCGKWL